MSALPNRTDGPLTLARSGAPEREKLTLLSNGKETPLILIVDDDQAMRLMIRRVMEHEGYTVAEVADGEQCLAAFTRLRPDIVLMDGMMPNLDGFSACSRLQAMPGGDSTPVLMVTALDDDKSVDKAFESGASDYVTKPIHWAVLRQRVRRLLRTRTAEEVLRLRDRAISAAANGIVITDPTQADNPITYVNPAFERLTGYTAAEMIGRNARFLQGPDTDPGMIEEIRNAMRDERECQVVILNYRKDGTPFWNELCIAPVRDSTSRLTHLVWVQHDISERKRGEQALQQANEKLRAWVGEFARRTREMTLLNEMGDLLQACSIPDEAYTVISRIAVQLFPEESGVLWMIRAGQNLVEPVAIWGTGNPHAKVFTPQECWALRRGRSHLVEDSGVGLLCRHLPDPMPRNYLCVPLIARGEALGIFYLSHPQAGGLDESRQRLAVTVTEHAGLALANLKLYETLRSQSIRDPLTGLFNRRYMEESLQREVRRAERSSSALGIVMADLDRLKHFNDRYGHDAGDTVLREIGAFLQSQIGWEDIACRYGGEEFTLLLPGASMATTIQRAEHLRAGLRALKISHRGQPLGQVTVSLGVAVFPEHGPTGEAVLRAADAALYAAKQGGRDCVVAAR